ncbi:proton-conducting transporter transmembrane domain-containing protein [Arcobacter cloacae]|uniref:Proton-conducting membrane transporter n=1 Tax=Arcobacter cloacae TaxID=1054034 RepID=A0A4Q0ZKZ6_9BACT|nr:proton-conducting transporter membrane subunit [Arcobacter cloacae]RXJ85881.1 proton-conducting membrane transporter [Arcobacter cloacae]
MSNSFYIILLLLSSFVPALIIFILKEERYYLRNFFNLIGIFFKLFFVFFLIKAVLNNEEFVFRYEFIKDLEFVLKVDYLSLLFSTLSSILWLFTTFYAIGYLKNSAFQSRFFGFFSLCVTATVGLSMAGNLFTFFLFYEFLTLVTIPLIIHNQNLESKKALIIYLKYTIFGGVMFLAGISLLYSQTGSVEFVSGGYLDQYTQTTPLFWQISFVILILGLGVKAAIFPLHGWLPNAMAAPAPVSALLHAVAVVKAGAFGIIRVVYEVYGINFIQELNLLNFLMIISCVTILYGSVMALYQTDIKKRLAYSTVSQVSYIVLGVSIFGAFGTIGGMVHLVHQGVMKITLFFCAGAFALTYGIKKIEQMNGLGKHMPLSSIAFTIAALGMIGLPPTAGFMTKWYLSLGSIDNQLWIVLVVLALSSLLNAAYFLPLVYRIWFLSPILQNKQIESYKGFESSLLLVLPLVFTAILTLLLGIFAFSDYSALRWVIDIVKMEYSS